MGVQFPVEFGRLIDDVVAAAPRLREAGVAKLIFDGVCVELAPIAPGKPLSVEEQGTLEARLHKLEQERAEREAETRRATALAAAGGFRRRG